jgi:hypothetical protein
VVLSAVGGGQPPGGRDVRRPFARRSRPPNCCLLRGGSPGAGGLRVRRPGPRAVRGCGAGGSGGGRVEGPAEVPWGIPAGRAWVSARLVSKEGYRKRTQDAGKVGQGQEGGHISCQGARREPSGARGGKQVGRRQGGGRLCRPSALLLPPAGRPARTVPSAAAAVRPGHHAAQRRHDRADAEGNWRHRNAVLHPPPMARKAAR